jgi:hypothetical protein
VQPCAASSRVSSQVMRRSTRLLLELERHTWEGTRSRCLIASAGPSSACVGGERATHDSATPSTATESSPWLGGRSPAAWRVERRANVPLRGLCAAAAEVAQGLFPSCPSCAAPVAHCHIFCGACDRILPPPLRAQLNLFSHLFLCVPRPPTVQAWPPHTCSPRRLLYAPFEHLSAHTHLRSD